MQIRFDDIEVRDFSIEDVQPFLDYWYRSPKGYLENLGVLSDRLKEESLLKEIQIQMIRESKSEESPKLNKLTILCKGKAIGWHGLTQVKIGDHGVFHAHIWSPEHRGQGIGIVSYVRACEVFMNRFGLNYILFKTPKHNDSPNRVKNKLGLAPVGEEEIKSDTGVIKPGTRAWIYKLPKEDVPQLISRARELAK